MANPYIGAHISLLSKAEIRYEGTLHQIDMDSATITLQNGLLQTAGSNIAVRSFGTEGRLAERAVAAHPDTFNFIVFRAGDIKDIRVNEEPKVEERYDDPAIVSSEVSGLEICMLMLPRKRQCHHQLLLHPTPQKLASPPRRRRKV